MKHSPSHRSFSRRRGGQGITEYAAIIAFVALVIGLVFAFAPDTMMGAISAAFSVVTSHVNNMSAASELGP